MYTKLLLCVWISLLSARNYAGPSNRRVVIVYDFDDVLYPTRTIKNHGGKDELIDLNAQEHGERLLFHLKALRDQYNAKIYVVSRGNIYRQIIQKTPDWRDIGVRDIEGAYNSEFIDFIGIEALTEANKNSNLPHKKLKAHAFSALANVLKKNDHPFGRLAMIGDRRESDRMEVVSGAVKGWWKERLVAGTQFKYQFFHIKDTGLNLGAYQDRPTAKKLLGRLLEGWSRRLEDVRQNGLAGFIGSRESVVDPNMAEPETSFSFSCRFIFKD